jgi:hypothetical protein
MLLRSMRTDLGGLTGKLSQAGYGVQSVTMGGSESSSLNNDRRDANPENQDAPPQHGHEPQHESRQQQQGERRRSLPFFFDLEMT